MKVTNKFNVGNEVFYISNGQLYKGVIDSVSITQRIDSTEIMYTIEDKYVLYRECSIFNTIEEATNFFLAEVNKN